MESKKILIVDDEKIARQRIIRLIKHFESTPRANCQNQVTNKTLATSFQIFQAANGVEALTMISLHKPDIIFLDIQMPEVSGFEVLQQIEIRTFQIIFQTAYDEYAVRAFDECACDYLLKPITQERFNKALVKAINNNIQLTSLQKLENNLKQNNHYIEKITYKKSGKVFFLKIEEIFCFISQNHYTSAFTKDGEHIIDFSITYLLERLNPLHFFRCHRGSIVALKYIKSLGSSTHSELELLNGIKLPVSRTQRPLLLSTLTIS